MEQSSFCLYGHMSFSIYDLDALAPCNLTSLNLTYMHLTLFQNAVQSRKTLKCRIKKHEQNSNMVFFKYTTVKKVARIYSKHCNTNNHITQNKIQNNKRQADPK